MLIGKNKVNKESQSSINNNLTELIRIKTIKTYEKDNDDINIKNNNNGLSKEIYYFKNEILKELNTLEQRINKKISSSNSLNNARNQNDYEDKKQYILEKIETINKKLYTYDSLKEKVDNLITLNKKNIDDIRQEIKYNFKKYDNIIKNNMIDDGLVGDQCQFKTYQQMIVYILNNISKMNDYKEQNNKDFISYKNKIDSLMSSFKTQMNDCILSMTQFSTTKNKNIEDSENRIKQLIDSCDERIVELKMDNNNYKNEFNDKYSQLLKDYSTIKNKIDTDFLNIKNIFEKNKNEFEKKLKELHSQLLKVNENIEKIKENIDIESKLNKTIKKVFDEDELLLESKTNKNKNMCINNQNGDKSKSKACVNPIINNIQQNNSFFSSDSNNNIDMNQKQMKKTFSYGRLILNDGDNSNNKKKDIDLLSNKTLSEENESDNRLKSKKNEQTNTIEYCINNTENKNIKRINNNINNNSKIFDDYINDSFVIKEIKLIDQIDGKIDKNKKIAINNYNKSMKGKEIIKKKIQNILFSKDIKTSELPKIEDIKNDTSIEKENKYCLTNFQKKKNNEYKTNPLGMTAYLKHLSSNTINQIEKEKINKYSLNQKHKKKINNIYNTILIDHNKEKKDGIIKKNNNNNISNRELSFNPFSMKKELKSKTCKGKLKIDYSFSFLKYLNNLSNNLNYKSSTNKNKTILDNSYNTINNMPYSESQKNINNKKEYKNIIKMPPPYDANLKSFFGVY